MITISIKNGDNLLQYTFTKPRIVIGSSHHADLVIEDPRIDTELLTIILEKGYYKVINVNNDPYLTLNTLPFGKRSLKKGDLLSFHSLNIEINQLELLRTYSQTLPHLNKPHKAEHSPAPSLQDSLFEENPKKIADETKAPFPFPSHWHLQYVEDNIKELEQEQEELEQEALEQEEEDASSIGPIRAGTQEIEELLDHPLQTEPTYETELVEENVEEEQEPLPSGTSRFAYGFLLVSAALALAFIFGFFYTPQHSFPQSRAVLAVADAGMALLYAQMNGLSPKKMDWSSPDTMRRLLEHVLYPRYASGLGQEGNDILTADNHIIDIYNTEKGGRFFIFARPESSGWLDWLEPKSTLLLDSKDLQLRIVKDIKPYQRLLAVNHTLNQENLRWLNSLIEHEEIIPFSMLVKEGHHEFMIPSVLSETGSHEDFIYNLPRYSPFTDHLLRKLLRQKGHIGGTADGRYERKFKEYLELKNIIFYTSQDLGRVVDLLGNFDLGTDPVHIVKISLNGTPNAEATILPLHGQM